MAERDGKRVIARNKKALHEYEILDTYEAGLVLKGPEVKSVRDGKVAFQDAFALIEGGEAWLYNLHIGPYEPASRENLDPTRTRKLLLTKSEIERLAVAVNQRGRTLVPLDLYFRRGYAKITLAVAKGKKLHDKRRDLRRDAHERDMREALGSG